MIAVGVAEPFTPPGIGMELTHHYAEVRPVETYAGQRVLILGKQNSGFELANGLLPWARAIVLASPSPAKLSVQTRSLAGVRARYVQPYEDFVLGGGVAVLDAALDRIERTEGGDGRLTVRLRRTDTGDDLAVEVDDVISATGFVTPILDLPDIGCSVSGRSRLPLVTPWWESTTLPGVYFAGTIGQAAKGLVKHGVPANSGAVHGARYNAMVLARRIATQRFGVDVPRPAVAPDALVSTIATELAEAPELWHQRAYLAARLHGRPGGRTGRRRRPAADPLPRRRRARRGRGHARGGRHRGDLPGPVHAASGARSASGRSRPTRCSATTATDARRRSRAIVREVVPEAVPS